MHGHEHGHDHAGQAHGHAHGHGHGHDHGHNHGHHHGHAHSHAPASFDRAFALGIGLNTAFVAVEAFYGWRVDSLALLADAGHNLSDVAGLVLAWLAVLAGRRSPDARHTYGWQRASLLAALANALRPDSLPIQARYFYAFAPWFYLWLCEGAAHGWAKCAEWTGRTRRYSRQR